MKKFLAVFDGFKMSESTMEYAIQLSRVAGAQLVGVFLDEFMYRSYNVYQVITTYENRDAIIKELDAKDKKQRDEAAEHFKKTCDRAKINFSVHRDMSIALQELKHETMFADLVIINEYETFTKKKEEPPTGFLKDLLADVQCPVLVVPDAFKPVDKIVLLYDGRPSALYAIKMFSYLFDSLLNLPVEVYTVKDRDLTGLQLPDDQLMREFMQRHFPKAAYVVSKGHAEEKILDHLRNYKENELVVLGAYQRSELSRLFKTSMADILMKELDTPIFIAHNK